MKFGLIGNPNVGKSLIFNQLTGLGVEVSNYPGTTIDLAYGNTCFGQKRFELVDLPGIYSLEGPSPEETLVRRLLESGDVHLLIAVLDATHLERNLYLFAEVAEYGLPMIAVVNMIDEAEKQGISIDYGLLSDRLGIDVVPTAAIKGLNIEQIIPVALSHAKKPRTDVAYDHHIEAALISLQKTYGVNTLTAMQALLGIGADPEMNDAATFLAREIEDRHHMSVLQIVSTNRHNHARSIAEEVLRAREEAARFDAERFLTTAVPGIPILIVIMVTLLIVVFSVGSFLSEIAVALFNMLLLEPFTALGLPPFPSQIGTSLLLALQAGLGIAFPFIFTFYIGIALLEDSGYLTRAAFLADQVMHRMGMHGQAIIPLVLGFGCTVPAILSIRLLKTRRERLIASFLVTLIPCSGRTVIIAGIVAAFIGIIPALTVYLIIFLLILLTAFLLARIAPGDQVGMILEMAPLRRPAAGNVLKKSWGRIQEFLVIAMPLLIVTSIILGVFQYAGIMDAFESIIAPFSELILGLPSFAVTALIFGVLRKEMALETLVLLSGTADLSSVMTQLQLYVFAVVSVLFIPCISTIAILSRVMGNRIAIAVSAYTVITGIVIGALINLLVT